MVQNFLWIDAIDIVSRKSLDITFCSEDECVKQCDMIIAIGGDGTILKCSLKGCEFEKRLLGRQTVADSVLWPLLNIHSLNSWTSFFLENIPSAAE